MSKHVIRSCVWETNSSTTHSTTIITKKKYYEWINSDLYYYKAKWNPFEDLPEEQQPVNGMLYTADEVKNFCKLNGDDYDKRDATYDEYDDDDLNFDHWLLDNCYYCFVRYESYVGESDLENDALEFVPESTEPHIALCLYGYDY